MYFFKQNKKLIVINDRKNIPRRGVKAQHSTNNGRKCYLLLHRGVGFRIDSYNGYSEAIDAFSMLILVGTQFNFVARGLSEAKLPFSTRDLPIVIFHNDEWM